MLLIVQTCGLDTVHIRPSAQCTHSVWLLAYDFACGAALDWEYEFCLGARRRPHDDHHWAPWFWCVSRSPWGLGPKLLPTRQWICCHLKLKPIRLQSSRQIVPTRHFRPLTTVATTCCHPKLVLTHQFSVDCLCAPSKIPSCSEKPHSTHEVIDIYNRRILHPTIISNAQHPASTVPKPVSVQSRLCFRARGRAYNSGCWLIRTRTYIIICTYIYTGHHLLPRNPGPNKA